MLERKRYKGYEFWVSRDGTVDAGWGIDPSGEERLLHPHRYNKRLGKWEQMRDVKLDTVKRGIREQRYTMK